MDEPKANIDETKDHIVKKTSRVIIKDTPVERSSKSECRPGVNEKCHVYYYNPKSGQYYDPRYEHKCKSIEYSAIDPHGQRYWVCIEEDR